MANILYAGQTISLPEGVNVEELADLLLMREASKQRPRTQFRKIAWSDLQKATEGTRHAVARSVAKITNLDRCRQGL